MLAVTNLWPEGGSFRGVFVHEQVAALRNLGHEVDVEVVAQARGRADYLLAARRIRARARSGRYDVVHVHYGLCAFAGRFAGRVPRVLSLYGSDINDPRQRTVTKFGWGGYAARIYVSRRLAQQAGDPDGVVIPNGVDFAVFRPVAPPEDRMSVRDRFGFAPHELVVLFGALPGNAVKRYDVFREVLAELRGRGLPVRELLLPEPGQPAAGVVAKLAAADVLLFTSRQGSEGSPTVVKEAAVVGLPVVSVDVGDVGEILAGVSPSAVVPFPTVADQGALCGALADATAEVLAAGTRADGRERLSWLDSAAVAGRIVEVYRRVVAQRQPASGPR